MTTTPPEESSPPLPWRRILIHGLLVVGLALAVLKVAASLGDFSLSLEHPGFLPLLLMLHAALILLAASLWRQALGIVTPVPLPYKQAMAHVGILLIAKYVPGKLWGLVGRGLHARRLGMAAGAVTTATALEQLAILGSGLLLVAAGTWHAEIHWLLPLLAIISFLMCPMGRKGIGHLQSLAKGPLKRLFPLVEQGSAHLCSRAFAGLCWLALGQWILNGVLLCSVAATIGVVPSHTLVIAALIAAPAAILSGFLFLFVPGGIGIREGVLVYYLEPVIGMEAALMTAILFRISDTLRDVIMGIWTAALLRNP
ncbi:MAG: hypothetical protein HQL83_02055 [Magnetococcales bacterium]|nr:hypothetical protein [Magnetococcales bacterium]